MKKFNVLYRGRKIYSNLTHEECAEVLQDLSEKFFSGDDIDPNLIELEEIYGTQG
jgi:hypothetical protein